MKVCSNTKQPYTAPRTQSIALQAEGCITASEDAGAALGDLSAVDLYDESFFVSIL